jgi:hypothetical protein
MGVIGNAPLTYPNVMAAVGRFVAKQQMADVCILEFENGIIVTGSILYSTGETTSRYVKTHVFSAQDLQKLIKEG